MRHWSPCGTARLAAWTALMGCGQDGAGNDLSRPAVIEFTGGVFQMGGAPFDPCGRARVTDQFFMECVEFEQAERIRHPVQVRPFRLDAHEVTNAQYRACVDAGRCELPVASHVLPSGAYTYGAELFDVPAYDDHPVVGVTWGAATEYCAAVGGRLPTEAEWEFAASDGNASPTETTSRRVEAAAGDCQTGDFSFGPCSDGQALAAGAAKADVTAAGVHDLHASVREWVADVFEPLAYCAPEDRAAYRDPDSPTRFRLGPDGPPASVATPAGCLDEPPLDPAEPATRGRGCNPRQTNCLGACALAFTDRETRSLAQRQMHFAELSCAYRAADPPEGTDCAGGSAACTALTSPENVSACQAYCACMSDPAVVALAGVDGNACLNNCAAEYVTCATRGISNGYEPTRAACIDPSAGIAFACIDTKPEDGDSVAYRMRPLCMPRSVAGAPYVDAPPAVDDTEDPEASLFHVIRGGSFIETETCKLRVTRRSTWWQANLDDDLGFRCAYDADDRAP